MPPGQQLAASHKWPVVGERAPLVSSEPWTVSIGGCVARKLTFSLADLEQLPQQSRLVDIHCVTRWSKLDQEFTGVLLSQLLAAAGPLADAKYVSFEARSPRHHSTSLRLADAVALGTLVVTRHAGQPLLIEHGGPVRVIVPGRYFYKSLKWLTKIELLSEDRLGYWEAEAGYHNHADPWREERYLAATITRQQAAELIRLRDFRGLDLRGIDASGRDLGGLQAEGRFSAMQVFVAPRCKVQTLRGRTSPMHTWMARTWPALRSDQPTLKGPIFAAPTSAVWIFVARRCLARHLSARQVNRPLRSTQRRSLTATGWMTCCRCKARSFAARSP